MRARRPDLGGRSTVFGTGAAVACEHPRAALAGIGVLDAGGTAADACVERSEEYRNGTVVNVLLGVSVLLLVVVGVQEIMGTL